MLPVEKTFGEYCFVWVSFSSVPNDSCRGGGLVETPGIGFRSKRLRTCRICGSCYDDSIVLEPIPSLVFRPLLRFLYRCRHPNDMTGCHRPLLPLRIHSHHDTVFHELAHNRFWPTLPPNSHQLWDDWVGEIWDEPPWCSSVYHPPRNHHRVRWSEAFVRAWEQCFPWCIQYNTCLMILTTMKQVYNSACENSIVLQHEETEDIPCGTLMETAILENSLFCSQRGTWPRLKYSTDNNNLSRPMRSNQFRGNCNFLSKTLFEN